MRTDRAGRLGTLADRGVPLPACRTRAQVARSRSGDQAGPEAGGHGVGPVARAELAEQPPGVGLHRVLRHEQLPADLGVALAVGHAAQHLQLALGQVDRAAAAPRRDAGPPAPRRRAAAAPTTWPAAASREAASALTVGRPTGAAGAGHRGPSRSGTGPRRGRLARRAEHQQQRLRDHRHRVLASAADHAPGAGLHGGGRDPRVLRLRRAPPRRRAPRRRSAG